MKFVGKNINSLRKKKCISQIRIAEILSMPIQEYLDIESGLLEINVSKLKRIATILEVPITDLVFETGSNPILKYQETISALEEQIAEKNKLIYYLKNSVLDLEGQIN